jgi:hypothetical protein
MDFVSFDLAGETYRLRFLPDDIQDVCRRLTPLQPPGGAKVTPPVLGTLLVNLDPDAIQFCMWAGLRHTPEYKKLDTTDAMKIVGGAIKRGAQWADFRRPIFRAMIACGLAEFSPVLKILDETEAQLAEEPDSGNAPAAPTPMTPPTLRTSFPTLTSTSGSRASDSGS